MLQAIAAPWIDRSSLHARYRFLQSGFSRTGRHQSEPLAFTVERTAVMFADLRGFTEIAEDLPPGEMLTLLHGFYTRLARLVARRNGAIEAFLGDGVMATFGAGDGPRAAWDALACAEAAFAAIGEWNAERLAAAQPAVRLSLGLNYGDVVLSDVTGERHAGVKALGDVVNVASRLEQLTRELDCCAIVSDDLVRAARGYADRAVTASLADFRRIDGQRLRGRNRQLDIWILPRMAPDAAPALS